MPGVRFNFLEVDKGKSECRLRASLDRTNKLMSLRQRGPYATTRWVRLRSRRAFCD
jgi:hypothetical protein